MNGIDAMQSARTVGQKTPDRIVDYHVTVAVSRVSDPHCFVCSGNLQPV